MATDAEDLFDRVQTDDGGIRALDGIARQGVGAYFLALSAAFISGTQAVFDVLIMPIEAMLDAIAGEDGLIEAIFGGPAGIVDAGAEASAEAVGVGGDWAIGPFSFVIGVGSVLLAGLLISRYLQEEETSDLIPFTFTDVPFVGTEEEGEE